MPKVTIFHCAFIYNGGGERIVLEQAKELEKRGYQVQIFAPIVDKKKCYPEAIKKLNVRPFFIHLPSWFPFRIALLMLFSCFVAPFLAFRFKDSDIIIGENQPGAWLAFCTAKVLKKKYFVYLCHPNKMLYPRRVTRKKLWQGNKDFFYLSFLIDLFKPLVKYLDNLSVRGGEKIFTNGFFIKKEIEKVYKKNCIGCPSGVNVFSKMDIQKFFKKRSSGQLKINGRKISKPYLLFIGRHEVWKRIDWAIKMVKKAKKSCPHLSLVIPGTPNKHTQQLKKLAKKLNLKNSIYFLGTISQKQLWELYYNASVFIFPSSKEDFGIVILEAMGCALPVVAWDSGGPQDSVVHNKTGFLIKPYNLEKFSSSVVSLIENHNMQKDMGFSGWNRVKNKFSWEKHIDILQKEIGKI